jgi:hypothetical protein
MLESVWNRSTHTGRIRSRSHQTAKLVILGDGPKMRIGSQNMRSSQIDQRLERQEEKITTDGGFARGTDARIYTFGVKGV